MKTKALHRFLLIIAIAIFAMVYSQKTSAEGDSDLISKNHKTIKRKPATDPDKALLIGEWSGRGTYYYIKITNVYDLGTIDISFYDPNFPHQIYLEMAYWSKLGQLLSVYIELKDVDFPGSNFKLNYIPERDVLVGEYYDAVFDKIYPVELNRIK